MVAGAFAGAALAAWVYLLFGRDFYWRARERLSGAAPDPAAWPAVVAVIPARDEADSIAAVIASHMGSDYPGDFRVILVDDQSTDGTADLALRAAAGAGRPLDIVTTPALPAGWTGKLWALRRGVEEARNTAPDAAFILFTDADIVHAPSTLRRLVAKADAEGLALASLMARLDARGLWGRLLVPAFVFFFQQLYPFPAANDPSRRVAAAAGGCVLVRRRDYDAAGGVDAIADRLIDDCALAALIKAGGRRRTWIGLADREVVSLRDNRSLASIWNMVARTAFTQLGRRWSAVGASLLGLGIAYLAGPLAAITLPLHGDAAAAAVGALAGFAMSVSYRPTLKLYGLGAVHAATLPIAAIFYGMMTLSSAVRHARGAGGRWKGRAYPANAC